MARGGGRLGAEPAGRRVGGGRGDTRIKRTLELLQCTAVPQGMPFCTYADISSTRRMSWNGLQTVSQRRWHNRIFYLRSLVEKT